MDMMLKGFGMVFTPSAIASMGAGSTLKAIISGIMGFMLAMVGFDPQADDACYNFGTLYLFDGLDLGLTTDPGPATEGEGLWILR